jgi:hypothetical protein
MAHLSSGRSVVLVADPENAAAQKHSTTFSLSTRSAKFDLPRPYSTPASGNPRSEQNETQTDLVMLLLDKLAPCSARPLEASPMQPVRVYPALMTDVMVLPGATEVVVFVTEVTEVVVLATGRGYILILLKRIIAPGPPQVSSLLLAQGMAHLSSGRRVVFVADPESVFEQKHSTTLACSCVVFT